MPDPTSAQIDAAILTALQSYEIDHRIRAEQHFPPVEAWAVKNMIAAGMIPQWGAILVWLENDMLRAFRGGVSREHIELSLAALVAAGTVRRFDTEWDGKPYSYWRPTAPAVAEWITPKEIAARHHIDPSGVRKVKAKDIQRIKNPNGRGNLYLASDCARKWS